MQTCDSSQGQWVISREVKANQTKQALRIVKEVNWLTLLQIKCY